jgi:hypothetical protein
LSLFGVSKVARNTRLDSSESKIAGKNYFDPDGMMFFLSAGQEVNDVALSGFLGTRLIGQDSAHTPSLANK